MQERVQDQRGMKGTLRKNSQAKIIQHKNTEDIGLLFQTTELEE